MASVNSATYSIRGFVSALGYAYLLALGVDLGIDLTKRMAKTPRYILYALLMMVMAVNGLYFTYNFYERKQVTVGELFNENEKRVSQYLLDRPEKQFTVYHDFPKNVYLSYIFMDSGNSAPQVTGKDGEVDSYTSNNVVFMKCPKLIDYATLTNTLVSESCMNLKTHDQLNSQVDLQQKILYKDLSLKTAYFIFE